MCGIAGFISKNEFPENAKEIITKMTSTLKHRGPDKQNVHLSPEIKAGMGHTRLSIIDLSNTGNQPMVSDCGRYTLVFNGEIYNYKELRELLISEGALFKGPSDSEVLFKALISWGVEDALKRLNGMFAFAFLDQHQKELYIARDRIGIKPIYYGYSNKNFIFGSELKAIKAHPLFNNSVCNDSIALFMRHNTIPAPWSIYENVFQLRAGYYLRFSIKRFEITRLSRYWELHNIAQKGAKQHFNSAAKGIEQLEDTLSESVRLRMQADVPYGAFLSGGIDSSLIVSLMQRHTSEKVKTFSIGFEQTQFNEAPEAQKIAKHLKTDHHSTIFTSKNAIDLIPNLCDFYDQPFADSSQLPTFLVSKMAKEHVTVCLSGDGGDELFAGYDRYLWGQKSLRWHKQFSPPTRYLMSNMLRSLSPSTWNHLAKLLFFLPSFRSKRMGDKIYKLAKILRAVNRFGLYKSLSSVWHDPDEVMLNSSEPLTALTDEDNWLAKNDFIKQAQFVDQSLYLPDDILHKVDRASMANSLEVRVPMLDHNVIETSWKFTDEMNIIHKKGKAPLRKILSKYVPDELMNRPKMGFGVPISDWLRGPLNSWANDLISEERLSKQNIFDPKPIMKVWKTHEKGRDNHPEMLWGFLMLQSWLDKNT